MNNYCKDCSYFSENFEIIEKFISKPSQSFFEYKCSKFINAFKDPNLLDQPTFCGEFLAARIGFGSGISSFVHASGSGGFITSPFINTEVPNVGQIVKLIKQDPSSLTWVFDEKFYSTIEPLWATDSTRGTVLEVSKSKKLAAVEWKDTNKLLGINIHFVSYLRIEKGIQLFKSLVKMKV